MSADRVHWCDRGWQGVYFGFCPNEKAWKHAMKAMGIKDEPYPNDSAGKLTTFTCDGKVTCIVTIRDGSERKHSAVEVAGLIVHECTHIWQAVRKWMAEKEPSIEFEAYSMQAIFMGIYSGWLDTRGKRRKRAAKRPPFDRLRPPQSHPPGAARPHR